MGISIQTADFDVGAEYQQLTSTSSGAVVMFVGKVRDFAAGQGLFLEHYPAMTAKVLADIVTAAQARWPIEDYRLIHRIGHLGLGEQIVLVMVSSAHRDAAFEAARYIMDYLKTQAPFWKKEQRQDGFDRWVEPNPHDLAQCQRWETAPSRNT